MGLDAQRQTILYTPSRRGAGSWNLAAEQLVRTAPAHFNLVLRPHPSQSLTARRKDRESFARVQKLIAARSGAFLDLGTRSLADLMVSDANSPSEESMFYDVPQMFLETTTYSRDMLRQLGIREAMHEHDLERLLTLYDCGPSSYISTPPDFRESLDRAIADAPSYANQRESYFAWVFGQRDRHANKRVAQAIKHHLLQRG